MTAAPIPLTPSALRAAFQERGIIPKKGLGQNFLIDQNILHVIVAAAGLEKSDLVLEIGTGVGSLTMFLAEKVYKVLSVEIDTRLFNYAKAGLTSYANIYLLNRDILRSKTTIDQQVEDQLKDWLQEGGLRLKVVANLPYHISTPVIVALLEGNLPVELMVLTLQRDIVDRLMASPGTKDYGILSVVARVFSEIEVLRTLPPEVFWPEPQVESAIVRLHARKEEACRKISNYGLFSRLVRGVFQTRRKILLNSLLMLGIPSLSKEAALEMLRRLDIHPQARGEALPLEGFIALAKELELFGKEEG
jgi:16S rRNA (adenine1518-N6/adenine1519-N6)-dimethyltransferase